MALKKVTIREVSKLAGVSISTVSRVLNGNNPVNSALKDSVLKAVETLGYKPNLAARTLKTRKSHSIYYVVPEIANPYFTEIYSGIQKVTEKTDYVSFMYETVNAQRVIHTLIMRGADGIIFDAKYRDDSKEDLEAAGIPWVQTNTPMQYPDKNSVKIDIFGATLDTIAYLKSMGHGTIGLITYMEKDHPIRERYRAFRHYAQEEGIHNFEEFVSLQSFRAHKSADGYNGMRELLERRNGITAVIALNDLTAIGAITAAVGMGYRVPEDVSIVGFDNTEIAKYCNPPLTTVNIPTVRQGEIATNMLFEMIGNRQAEPYSVELHTELIIRKTVNSVNPGS